MYTFWVRICQLFETHSKLDISPLSKQLWREKRIFTSLQKLSASCIRRCLILWTSVVCTQQKLKEVFNNIGVAVFQRKTSVPLLTIYPHEVFWTYSCDINCTYQMCNKCKNVISTCNIYLMLDCSFSVDISFLIQYSTILPLCTVSLPKRKVHGATNIEQYLLCVRYIIYRVNCIHFSNLEKEVHTIQIASIWWIQSTT